MSDPTRGGYKRKSRRGTVDSMQIRRQEAHDELDDSRLNEDQAREENAVRIHEARSITSYLHDNDDRTRNFAQHDDSADAARDRLTDYDMGIDPGTTAPKKESKK